MTPDCFLDTNILFYAAMGRFAESAKYRRARQIMAETHFALSGQVLQEFYVTVTRKSDKPLPHVHRELVTRGAEIASRYQISYWDGAILAGAERTGAPLLYTEDLNDGQTYGSVRAQNPFKLN